MSIPKTATRFTIEIKQFVGEMKRKAFLDDDKTRSAVAFKIENIGEASQNIPAKIRAKYSDLGPTWQGQEIKSHTSISGLITK